MGSPTTAADPDALVISRRKTEKDLKVSVGMLIAGVVIYAVAIALTYWASSQLPNNAGFFVLDIVSGMGSVFVLIGAIFTGINWWLLRKSRPLSPK